MAKLIVLLATLALFVFMANASIYRTTVEIDEEEANQWGQQGKCQRQFQQQQQLRGCQRWIRQSTLRSSDGYDADELAIEDGDVENQSRLSLRQCCNQLHQVDRMCVCPVLRRATQQASSRLGQYQGQKVGQMFQTAGNLPNMCNIPVGRCQFSASPY